MEAALREVAAKALRDAADALAVPDLCDDDEDCDYCFTVRWLRERADFIEQGVLPWTS